MEKRSGKSRVTLYVKPEHQGLLHWAREYTQADSLSDAVFLALAELKNLIKQERLQALAQTHGIWKGDQEIEKAFKELERGWEAWRKQFEGS